LLLMVIWVAIIFRYQKLPRSLTPTLTYDFFFWLSVISILAVSVYGVWQVFH